MHYPTCSVRNLIPFALNCFTPVQLRCEDEVCGLN